MLNIIDVFSKYAWSIPLKDKKGLTVVDAFREIVKQSRRVPKHIWVDKVKNSIIKIWMNGYKRII